MTFKATINKKQILDVIKTNPEMSFREFQEKCKAKISDVSFYVLRKKYRKENNIRPFSLLRKPRKNKVKRPYRKTGKYSKRSGRRAYTRTYVFHLLWSYETDNLKPEVLEKLKEALQSLVHNMQKSKRMNLELVQTLEPAKLELREYHNP